MKTKQDETPRQAAARILFDAIVAFEKGTYYSLTDMIEEETPAVQREIKKQYKKLSGKFLFVMETIGNFDHDVMIDDWIKGI